MWILTWHVSHNMSLSYHPYCCPFSLKCILSKNNFDLTMNQLYVVCNSLNFEQLYNKLKMVGIQFDGWLIELNVTVNNFSVMLGRSHRFLGITSTFGELMCLAQGHNTVLPGVRGINHQATALPHSI